MMLEMLIIVMFDETSSNSHCRSSRLLFSNSVVDEDVRFDVNEKTSIGSISMEL